jgi:hypothetical protein
MRNVAQIGNLIWRKFDAVCEGLKHSERKILEDNEKWEEWIFCQSDLSFVKWGEVTLGSIISGAETVVGEYSRERREMVPVWRMYRPYTDRHCAARPCLTTTDQQTQGSDSESLNCYKMIYTFICWKYGFAKYSDNLYELCYLTAFGLTPGGRSVFRYFTPLGPRKFCASSLICSYSVMCKQKQHKKLTKHYSSF